MFPLKTERSSSGLIEFSNVAEAVLAIMKCNHIPIESKGMSEYIHIQKITTVRQRYSNIIPTTTTGTKFPFIMKLCFSSSKNMNSAWNNETSEIMDGGELLN